jgi:hypothetical protein
VGNHVLTSNLMLSDKSNNTSTSYYTQHKKLKDMEYYIAENVTKQHCSYTVHRVRGKVHQSMGYPRSVALLDDAETDFTKIINIDADDQILLLQLFMRSYQCVRNSKSKKVSAAG